MLKDVTRSALSLLLGLACTQAACTGLIESEGDGSAASGKGGKKGTQTSRDGGSSGTGSEYDEGGDDKSSGPKVDTGIGNQVFALCESDAEQPGPRLLRLLTRRELRNTVKDLLHLTEPDVSKLPLEPRVRGFDNNASASVVTSRHVDEYLNLSEALADKAVREQKGSLVSCQPSSADCPRTFVQSFGLKAFRRPLTSDESKRYEALFDKELTGGSFDEGLKLAITAMLVSPNHLYRSEVGEKAGSGHKLTPYEVASALSYLYWGTMPDQALFDAASKGQLSTPAQIEAQARRLLTDERAKAQIGEFSLQWLRSDNLLTAFKDKTVYPSFQDSVRKAMLEEQQRFVTDVALVRDGKFSELFTADYVFANAELARFYGLSGGSNEFSKVPVTKESDRGGLLGLGAVMASHAHSMESSPIKRGVFVRDRLLCQDLSPPPANLDTTPPGLDPTLTTRARFAKHTNSPTCSGCHKYIDSIGFGLEGFDGVGQKRTQENGMAIDISGKVVGLEALGSDDTSDFEGQRELSALLAESESAQSCLTLQYYRFARGYAETEQDACSLSTLQQRFRDSDLTIKELLVQISLLESFTNRRAQ